MSIKKTITMPDEVYLELKQQADLSGLPFNRLAVQRLRGDGVVILNPAQLGQGLQDIYEALNRCPFDLQEVKRLCRLSESFLAELTSQSGLKP